MVLEAGLREAEVVAGGVKPRQHRMTQPPVTPQNRSVVGELIGFVFLGCLVSAFTWVAISGDARRCSSSLDLFLPHGWGCRGLAGIFSILFLPITILIGRRLLYRALGIKQPSAY